MKWYINNNYGINIYPIFIAIGFLLLLVVNLLRSKNYDIKWFQSIILSFLVEIISIISAYLMYVIENPNDTSFSFSFYGVVLIMPVIMIAFKPLFKKISLNNYYNYISITVPLELCIIRIGCFLSGCCYGIPAKWGVAYYDYALNFYRIPVQLFESVICLIIYCFLQINEKKKWIKINSLFIFIILYGISRFFLEFLRDTPKIFFETFSMGQMWACVSIMISLLIINIIRIKKNKNAIS